MRGAMGSSFQKLKGIMLVEESCRQHGRKDAPYASNASMCSTRDLYLKRGAAMAPLLAWV
jgi:hypothetical protein